MPPAEHKILYLACLLWLITTVTFLFGCSDFSRQTNSPERDLAIALEQKDFFRRQKVQRLDSIQEQLSATEQTLSKEQVYATYKVLYNEYRLYSFNSAYHYATCLRSIADEIDRPVYRVDAKVALGYILARGGFFKEAIDTLSSITLPKEALPDSVLSNYYIRFGRTYHDLADYTKDENFTVNYNRQGNLLLSKSLPYLTDSSTIYYVRGKIALKDNRVHEAKQLYLRALEFSDPKDAETLSTLFSTLAFIDRKLKQDDEAIHYYVLATINDLHHAFNESVSLRGLATMLYYHKKNVNLASEYINEAFENATFYGTRHRINVIGSLLPIFMGEKLDIEQMKKQQFQESLIITSLFLLVLLVAIIYILVQMKRLHRSRRLMDELNQQLKEANHIKNSYIGHYLNTTFTLVNQIDNFVTVSQQKLDNKKYDSLRQLILKLNAEHNRKSIFADFDNTFLLLFPSFVAQFNQLLLPDAQIVVENGVFNSTLRIFALIRLGISDTEQIAELLGYSVNTVYNYRVRLRNKAIDPKRFEEEVKKIGV
jgi:tetratricopeptide (TPR) repeat protein